MLALFATTALSQNTTWTGATNGNWTTASNWSGGIAPGAGYTAIFGAAGSPNNDPNELTTLSINKITFANGGAWHGVGFQGWNVNSTGTFIEVESGNTQSNQINNSRNNGGTIALKSGTSTILNNGSNSTGLFVGTSYDVPNAMLRGASGANSTLVVDGSGNTTIGIASAGTTMPIADGASGGSLRLTKNGSGTLLLTAANTYTGVTTINAGTLQIGNNSSASIGSTSIVNHANLVYSTNISSGTTALASSTTGTGNLTATAKLIKLNGNITQSGNVSLTSGTNASGAGIELVSDTTITAGNITLTGDLGRSGANGGNLNLNTSATNGAINLDVSVGRNTIWYGFSSFTANAGTGNLTVSGANAGSGNWRGPSGATLTGALNISSSFNIEGALNLNATGNSSITGNLGLATSSTNTWAVDPGLTMTVSGNISGTSAAIAKNGTGTLVLQGNNTYTGATTINGGTLQAAAAGAVGGSTVINVNSGSFLVTAANAVNDSAAINLLGGTLAVSGTFDETVGLLTLSANSVIDLSGFTGTLRFAGVGSWSSGVNLAIWNWNGISENGNPVGNGANTRHIVFTDNSGLNSYLDRMSFYSDNGSSFAGSGFEKGFSGGGTEIIVVPEPGAYLTAAALLTGLGITLRRHRLKRNPLERHGST